MQNHKNHEKPMSSRCELFSEELERKLLGVAFSNQSAVDSWTFLLPEHFHFPAHHALFKKLKSLRFAGHDVSPLTITLDAENAAQFEQFGGIAKYIVSCMGMASSDVATMDHRALASRVADLHSRRAFRDYSLEAVEAVENLDNNFTVELEKASAAIAGIQRGNIQRGFRDEKEITESILEALRDVRKPDSTGIQKLDEAMGGGLYAGKSYGFCARKKVGKTIMAGTISYNLSESGIKHLFICGEMSPEEIHQRVLSRRLDVYPSSFRSDFGKTDHFQAKVASAVAESQRNTIYYNAPGLTFNELRSICMAAVIQHHVKGIVLDYLQLVGGKEGRKSTSEHQDDVSQWIADFGRKNSVWNICMGQINQEGNTRGGEGMRLAFDQVYQIHRKDLTDGTAWVEMMDTRYTPWQNIGSEDTPGLFLNEKGLFFHQ